MKDVPALAEQRGLPSLVWYARPDGSYYGVNMGLAEMNLKDRKYFPHILAGEPVAGTLAISPPTGKKSVIVAVPLRAWESGI